MAIKLNMYVVIFKRNDGKPNEEYYYHTRKEAEYHKSLFDDDDSGLYSSITIAKV